MGAGGSRRETEPETEGVVGLREISPDKEGGRGLAMTLVQMCWKWDVGHLTCYGWALS